MSFSASNSLPPSPMVYFCTLDLSSGQFSIETTTPESHEEGEGEEEELLLTGSHSTTITLHGFIPLRRSIVLVSQESYACDDE